MTDSPQSSFTPIDSLGEFGLIERIRDRIGEPGSPAVVYGIGDDAAVLNLPNGANQVVSTDLLIEHVHFDRTYTPMRHLGYKAVTSNVSDIAAMCGSPDAATISLGLPHNISVEMIDALYDGILDASERYGIEVVGGDVSGSHKFIISVTVIGHADPEHLTYRSGARPGDALCVSGSVGAAYAGLGILQHHKERLNTVGEDYRPDLGAHAWVIQRHLRPDARTDVVTNLLSAGIRPTAMIDISDGLASEIRHICGQSRCSARIAATDVPLDGRTIEAAKFLERDPLDFALYGGEDYELLFSVQANDVDRLKGEVPDMTVVGWCTDPGTPSYIVQSDGSEAPIIAEGFKHF